MFTPQNKSKNKLPAKIMYVKLSPHKYKEHEQAAKFLNAVQSGMAVHTLVAAVNYFEDARKRGVVDAEGKPVSKGPQKIETRVSVMEKSLKKLTAEIQKKKKD